MRINDTLESVLIVLQFLVSNQYVLREIWPLNFTLPLLPNLLSSGIGGGIRIPSTIKLL